MFGIFNKKEEIKQIDNKALENMFAFLGQDLPIVNSDGYDYINNILAKVGVVYECTDLIYKKVIKSPLTFWKIKDKKAYKLYQDRERKDTPQALALKAKAMEEVEIKALSDLLDKPNPQQSYSNFIGILVLSYLLTGNSYTWKQLSKATGRPIELWAFPELFIESGGTYNPIKSYYQFYQTESQKQYESSSIWHSKTPNPSFDIMGSQLYGISPLRAYLEQLRAIEEGNKQASKQLKSGGVLSVIFPRDKDDEWQSDQRKAFIDKARKNLNSMEDYSRISASSIALDSKQIGLPSVELDLLNINSANEEAIYRAYHVPLQYHNQKASTSNNQSTAVKQLVYDAVAPMCDVISEMLTNFVGVHFDNTVIILDYTQLDEMSVNMKEIADYVVPLVQSGVLSRDDARTMFRFDDTGLDYMQEYWIGNQPMSKLFSAELQPTSNNNGSNNNNSGK